MRLYVIVAFLVVSVTVLTVTASPIKEQENKNELQILEDLRELLKRRKGDKGNGRKGGKGGQKESTESSEEVNGLEGEDEFCHMYRAFAEYYDGSSSMDMSYELEPIERLLWDLHAEYLNAKYIIRCELPYTGCEFSTEFLDQFDAMIYGSGSATDPRPTQPPPVSFQELGDSMDEVRLFLGEVSTHLSGPQPDSPIELVSDSLNALETSNYCSIVKLIPLLYKMELLGVEGSQRCFKMFETFLHFHNYSDVCEFDNDFTDAAREDAQCLKDEIEALNEVTNDVSGDLSHVQAVSRVGVVAATAYRLEMDYHIMQVNLDQYFKTREEFGGSFCGSASTTESVVVAQKKRKDLDSSKMDKIQQLISLLKKLQRK